MPAWRRCSRPRTSHIATLRRRAEPARPWHDHAGRLVPQQPDAGAQRRRRSTACRRAASAPPSSTARPSPIPSPASRRSGKSRTRAREIERLLKAASGRRAADASAWRCWARTTRRSRSRCTTSAWRSELGLIASMHQGGGAAAHAGRLGALEARGPARPAHQHRARQQRSPTRSSSASCDLGMSFSVTPENEMAQGHGHPHHRPPARARHARRRSASISKSADRGDMFTVARMALAHPARLDNAAERARRRRHPADLDDHRRARRSTG